MSCFCCVYVGVLKGICFLFRIETETDPNEKKKRGKSKRESGIIKLISLWFILALCQKEQPSQLSASWSKFYKDAINQDIVEQKTRDSKEAFNVN